ncbi:hypothetical protein RA272_27625, partial [Pseudomonas syringae pv. tagetis]|uniref:hypothetical protein n=1 Tax=Pseudomonas syringae group genomosp. 7 TaxID=251699 RepID=UPI00376FD65C
AYAQGTSGVVGGRARPGGGIVGRLSGGQGPPPGGGGAPPAPGGGWVLGGGKIWVGGWWGFCVGVVCVGVVFLWVFCLCFVLFFVCFFVCCGLGWLCVCIVLLCCWLFGCWLCCLGWCFGCLFWGFSGFEGFFCVWLCGALVFVGLVFGCCGGLVCVWWCCFVGWGCGFGWVCWWLVRVCWGWFVLLCLLGSALGALDKACDWEV